MKTFALLVLLLASTLACAAERFRVDSLVLLQPDPMLKERVCCIEDFANYLKGVNAAADDAATRFEGRTPTSGFIVVAVRPDGQVKAWTDFSPRLSSADEATLIAAVEAVAPFQASNGTVLAASRVSYWGAPASEQPLPNPEEWRAAFKKLGEPTEVTDMVDGLWPSPAGS